MNTNHVPEDRDVSQHWHEPEPRAGVTLTGVLGALVGGLLVFSVFVYGASRNENAQQGSQQQAATQSQQAPSTTGSAPNR